MPNFSYGYHNDFPRGWLLNPQRCKIILFNLFKNSDPRNKKIRVRIYFTNNFGEPQGLYSSSQMLIDDAWNKWHDLQLRYWTFEELELPKCT